MSPVGAIIMGIFAGIWWIVGTRAVALSPLPVYLVPAIITGFILVVALRQQRTLVPEDSDEKKRRDRVIGIASGGEGIAILVAANVLANTGRQAFTAPAIAIIVGLHFVPIAHSLPAHRYYLTSGLLVLLGVGGCVVPDVAQRSAVVGVGAACILWLTSVAVVRHGSQHGRHRLTPSDAQ